MTLSDAIRLGAMLKPQGFGGQGQFTSCALRAAMDAAGIQPWIDCDGFPSVSYCGLHERFPITHALPPICPECGHQHPYVYMTIYHLNDNHRWTREQIADWVETIEPQEDATQVRRSVEVLASANIGADNEERL